MEILANNLLLSLIAEGISPSFINGQHGKAAIEVTLGTNETMWLKVQTLTDVYLTSAAIVTTDNKIDVEIYRDIYGTDEGDFVEANEEDVIHIIQKNRTSKKGDYELQTKALVDGTFTPDSNATPFASASASTKSDVRIVSDREPIGMPYGAIYIKLYGTGYSKLEINFRELI